jgi:hypothetical protein
VEYYHADAQDSKVITFGSVFEWISSCPFQKNRVILMSKDKSPEISKCSRRAGSEVAPYLVAYEYIVINAECEIVRTPQEVFVPGLEELGRYYEE